jgi:hypothetical protein
LLSYRINGMFWSDFEMVRRRRLRRPRLRQQGLDGATALKQQHQQQQQQPQRQRRRLVQLSPQPWNRSHIHLAMTHGPSPAMDRVDVLVQRITFPWTPLDHITHESLERNTRRASEVFGMHTLVYVNFYFCNNVVDPIMHLLFRDKLQLVRDYARTYVPAPDAPLRRILLLDMDRLVDLFNEDNARRIGYDPDHEPFDRWMMSHYRGPPDVEEGASATHRDYHAQVCGAPTPDHALSCPTNPNFVDGMHFCPETMGGRIGSGLACLFGCAERHHRDDGPTSEGARNGALRSCERRCNAKFMSLDPIPLSEMVRHNETSDA